VVRIEHAQISHILLIAPNVRESDRQEILASGGLSVEDALRKSIAMRGKHYAGFVDDDLVCIFGVGDLGAGVGLPYMIGTHLLEQNKKNLLIYSRGFLDKIRREYDYLVNFVDARNTKAILWLSWLGFKIHDPRPYGFLKLPFCKFDMEIKRHV
jgi:hypothetical protein